MRPRHLAFALCSVAVLFGCDAVVTPSESDFDVSPDGGGSVGPGGSGIPTEGGSGPDGTPGGSTSPDPSLCELGPAQIRLLTAEEYDNTVLDLFGTNQRFGQGFPGQPVVGGFDNNAGALGASERMVEEVAAAAEAISSEAVTDLDRLLPCEASDGVSCAEQFIADYGERIFRRPLSGDELARYRTTFDAGNEFNFATGIEFVLNAMLQSPSFLYRTEVLQSDGRFDPYTLASRLSYFLWNSTPDTELLAAARSGALNDDAEVRRQAERMISDEKGRRTVRNFTR
ncbi:MAG: DUF1592 domain-containing protein, partial [Myxococcota bacterium]